jgi:hypothetical protein
MINKPIGRLALRVEGDKWVAYYALENTMDDAIWLGSIRMAIVCVPAHKQSFMVLMREAVGDILEAKTGTRPEWDRPHSAPEHERAGRG